MGTEGKKSKAASVRIGAMNTRKVGGQNAHDLRTGRVPSYVDVARIADNSVIIQPHTAGQLRDMAVERRERQTPRPKRAMRSDAAVATRGVITLSHAQQAAFEGLPVSQQNDAYHAVASRIARELNTELTGLVVHRDESSPHAHFQLCGRTNDGQPISKVCGKEMSSRLQDFIFEEMSPYLPTLERGKPKKARIKAGEDPSKIYHRTVRQLHTDLPKEFEALLSKRNKLRERIHKLENYDRDLTDKENKRLATYQAREDNLRAEISAAEGRLADLSSEHVKGFAEGREEGLEVHADDIKDKVEKEVGFERGIFKGEAEKFKNGFETLRDTLKEFLTPEDYSKVKAEYTANLSKKKPEQQVTREPKNDGNPSPS